MLEADTAFYKFILYLCTDLTFSLYNPVATITTSLDKWLTWLNKVILCVQRHATMFVQVYANPFIGERIMNIKKWEVRRNVHFS